MENNEEKSGKVTWKEVVVIIYMFVFFGLIRILYGGGTDILLMPYETRMIRWAFGNYKKNKDDEPAPFL